MLDPMWWFLLVRLAVFTAVFAVVARKTFTKKWALPLVAFVFAALNTGLYYVLKPLVSFATLGVLAYVMPLLVNALLLGVTARIFQSRNWFKLDGFFATMWIATWLTVAHGALWLLGDFAKLT